MKRLINNPETIVEELVEGYTKAFSDKVKVSNNDKRVVTRTDLKDDKVKIVIGGGSGHEPMFLGYVGKGLADAAVIGNINTSPDPFSVFNAIKEVKPNKGCLLLYGNYMGDVLNFDMAQDMARDEGYEVESVQITDDVTSNENKSERRGIAGDFFVIKAASAAAEKGMNFEEVLNIAKETNKNTSSMGVALGAAEDPRSGKLMFDLEDGFMEIGMGLHGEAGIRRGEIESIDEVVEEILDPCLKDLELKDNDEVAVLINGLGATAYMDLFIMNKKLNQILSDKNIKINKTFIGNYATTMNMPGQSITLLKLDEKLKELINYPAEAPYFTQY